MFFYSILFVASLIAAIAIPVIFYLFKGTGTAVCQAILPSSDNDPNGYLKTDPGRMVNRDPSTSMGLMHHERPRKFAWADAEPSKLEHELSVEYSYSGLGKTHSVPPNAELRQQGAHHVFHEEKLTDVGRSYKVTRRVMVRGKNLRA